MTDFYTVVHRAISALPDKSGPNRRAVYDKARKALLRQLQSFDPPLPSADVTSQRLALEDAIRKIESEIARNLRTRRAKEASRPESPPPASRETQRERPAPADDARPSRRVEAAAAPVPGTATAPVPAEAVDAEATGAGARDVSPPEPPSPEGTIERGGRVLPAAAEAVPADAMTPLVPGKAAAKAPGETVETFAAAATDEGVPPPSAGGFAEPGETPSYIGSSGDEGAPGLESSVDSRGDLGPAGSADEDVGEEAAVTPQPPRSPEERRERRRRRQERQQREQAASEVSSSDIDVAPAEVAAGDLAEAAEPTPPRRRRRRRRQEVGVAATRTEQAPGEAGEADLAPPADADEDERGGRLPPGIAAPHELARRSDRSSKVARFVVPVLVTLIVIGLGAGVYAQRDQILAMISPAPPQVSSSAPSGTVSKKVTDRLGAPPESGGDDLATRPVTTTRVITPSEAGDEPGDTVADEPGDDTAAASPGGPEETGDGPTELETASVPPAASVTPDTPATETTARVRRAESSGSPAPASSPTGEQRAILYEEGAAEGEEGAVVNGQVNWEIVNQSFAGQDPEPVVRATVDLPGRDLKASLVIRENRDDTLPASHLLEISFQSASGGASEMVANVPGLIMKEAEDARGNALVGAAARVSTGLFWIALSADPEDEQTNRGLLSDRTWIDVPILYENGQRAILTLQKGGPGERAVSQAFEAWSKG